MIVEFPGRNLTPGVSRWRVGVVKTLTLVLPNSRGSLLGALFLRAKCGFHSVMLFTCSK